MTNMLYNQSANNTAGQYSHIAWIIDNIPANKIPMDKHNTYQYLPAAHNYIYNL